MHIEKIDYLTNEIDRRFNQEGLKNLVKLESILLDQTTKSLEELSNILNKMSDDFDIVKLHAQLVMLHSVILKYNVLDVINYFKKTLYKCK